MTNPLTLEQVLFKKILLPGDLLLYSSNGPMGRMIKLKTSSKVTHSEIYIGGLKTIASRDGKGVDTYDFETKNLAMVLRPTAPVDVPAMIAWHDANAKGQGYDWVGLFMGFVARRWGRENKKMWCSEHSTRAYRNGGGFFPFRREVDADSIHPGDFFKSAMFREIWVSQKFAKELGREVVSNLVNRKGSGSARPELLQEPQSEEGEERTGDAVA